MTNYLIVDGNSLGHFANNGSKLSLGEFQIQAVYGFLRTLRNALAAHPGYWPMVLWDGIPWRHRMFPDYKAQRENANTKHEVAQLAMRDAYKRQRPMIQIGLRLLGVPQVSALNMEADDLAGLVVDRYAAQGRVVLFTGDKDWIQLVGKNVIWKDFANKRVITEKNFEEMTGAATPRQFVEIKALAGDGGDNIGGVGGIGEKGAIEFLKTYGSFNEFLNRVTLEKTIDINSLPKKFRALIEDESKAIIFDRNIRLMDLRTPHRPKPEGLNIDRGAPGIAGFRIFCDRLLFASITQELEEWLRVFPAYQQLNQTA